MVFKRRQKATARTQRGRRRREPRFVRAVGPPFFCPLISDKENKKITPKSKSHKL